MKVRITLPISLTHLKLYSSRSRSRFRPIIYLILSYKRQPGFPHYVHVVEYSGVIGSCRVQVLVAQ